MAKEGVTLDTVTITIESDASKSTAGLDKLAASLTNLKSAISGGFANINKLANGLANLKTSSEGLSDVAKNLEPLSKIGEALKPLSDIKATGFNKIINSLDKIPVAMNNITPNAIENVARVSNELGAALSPLASKLESIGQGYSAISKLADKYGVSVTKVRDKSQSTVSVMTRLKNALSKLSTPFRKLKDSSSDFGKVASRHFDKVTSKIKQLGLSLIGTRTIFTMVRKAVSEYMQLDEELSKFTTNVWRALGAQLAPVIEYVMELFKQFVRVIYSFVYAITGIDLIARANEKAMAGWGKSAKDALGTLQKFDDLNVVEFPKSTGSDNKLIELDKIDLTPIQWLVDLIKELKDAIKNAFDTGEWLGVGKVVAKILNKTFEKINVNTLKNKLFKVVDDVNDYINGFIDNLDFQQIFEKLSDMFITLFSGFDRFIRHIPWKKIGKMIGTALSSTKIGDVIVSALDIVGSITKGFTDAFTNIPWDKVGKNLSDTIRRTLSKLDEIIKDIPWNKIGNAIKDFILNIDWVGIFNDILKILLSLITGLGETILGLLGIKLPEGDGDSTDFSEKLDEIKTKLEPFKEDVGYIFNDLTTVEIPKALDKGKDNWSKFTNDLKTIWDENGPIIEENVTNTMNNIGKKLKSLYENDFKPSFDNIGKDYDKLYNNHIQPFMTKLGNNAATWTKLFSMISGSTTESTGIIGKVISWLSDMFTSRFGVILDVVGWVIDAVTDLATTLVGFASGDWKTGLMGLYNIAADVLNPIIKLINSVINTINEVKLKLKQWGIETPGSILTPLKEIERYDVSTGKRGTSKGSKGYATGGYPEKGQYFYARENGIPEYVGSIGTQTAVANNTQIVEGIKQGVKEAINEADFEFTNVVNVGNETLYKAQKSYNKMQNNKYGTINV